MRQKERFIKYKTVSAACIESEPRFGHVTRCQDNSSCDSDVWNGSLPQVWNSNAVKDEFMGQVVLSGSLKDSSGPQKLQLRKGGRNGDEMPGNISLRIVTATQLTVMWPPNHLDVERLPLTDAFTDIFVRRVICDGLNVNSCYFL